MRKASHQDRRPSEGTFVIASLTCYARTHPRPVFIYRPKTTVSSLYLHHPPIPLPLPRLFFYTVIQQPNPTDQLDMSTTKGLCDALFALSGNPALLNVRKVLVSHILHHDLIDVITYGLKTGIPLLSLRTITIRVLDELAAAQAANVVAAPGGDAHGGDDGGDDENGGGGRKSNQNSHERTGQEGEG